MASTGRPATPRGMRVRPVLAPLLALCAAGLVPTAPALAQAGYTPVELREGIASAAGADLRPYYKAHGNRPLWISDGRIDPAAYALLELADTADFDGLSARKLRSGDLDKALRRAERGDLDDLAKLEVTASRIYAAYVKALRAAPRAEMRYESEALAPVVPTTQAALEALAKAPSREDFVRSMGWMHPLYAPMRQALLQQGYSEDQRMLIARNLQRVRALPAYPSSRYVLVDAAGARLYMYRDGRVVDSMKVVVGKPEEPTPMMAGFVRYAIVNPYWNVPEDLSRSRIAANVLSKGMSYLKEGGYQVLDSWDADAKVLDPKTVDWQAVADGRATVRVRQLPGGDNFMGRVKYEFPNPQGIYLHDTPAKDLMTKDARAFSSGCVRLEDAPRLGKFLFGKPIQLKVKQPEKRLNLPEVVPVYITYLTAFPQPSGAIAFRDDPYNRDGRQLAYAD